MLETRPTEVYENVYPRSRVLLPGQNIQCSSEFPSSLDAYRGKTFRILKTVQVRYQLSWILPALHYKDINLSNEDSGEKLYPESATEIWETIIGFKPGNYFGLIYFPANQPIYQLGYYSMIPSVSDAALKYLGAISPADNPVANPVLKLYTFYKLDPFIIRMVVDDGIDYEKMSWSIVVNRCKVEEYALQQGEMAKYIPYITELNTRWA